MEEDKIRSFGTFLADIEEGQLHADLSRALQDAVAALHDIRVEQGGKPKATLTLKLEMMLDGDVIEARGDFVQKLPKLMRRKGIFYATPDNLLTRKNPRQQELPLRTVSETKAPPRAV